MKVKQTIEIVQDFPKLGEKIAKARKQDSRPLTVLCKSCKLSRGHWYKLEQEKIDLVTLETIRKIEKVLGVNLGVLIDASKATISQ